VLHCFAYSWRGWVAHATGNLALAREMFDACYQIGRATGHRTSLAHGSSFLGRVELAEGNRNEAYVRFSFALMLHLDIGDGWGLQLDLEGLAAIAVERGRAADGARLMGAVDAMRERVSVALPATDHAERARLSERARERLGAAFDVAYDEGRRMSMDDVVRMVSDSIGAETAEYRIPATETIVEVAAPAPTAVAPLRVLALGPLQVIVNDVVIESSAWGSARPRELLMYLLLHPDGRTKEQVGLDFWPDASTEQLRNNFHVTLHRLRKALGATDWVVLAGDRYRVAPDVLREFDVTDFERETTAARKALKRKEDGAAQALERALARYRGDLLDGEPAGDWHVTHRERLQRLYVDALMELGDRLALEERYAKAADAYRRVLARDDLHEEAVRALMTCHAKVGERAQALRLYQRFAERLAKELEAEPDEETTELAEGIQRGAV
jgi:DNA-binding SARP family transcriptional activator